MAENYTLKPGVTLSSEIEAKVKQISDRYNALTGRTVVVTSGTRTARSQASAMYGKLAGGDDLSIYKNQTAAQEIRQAYDDGVVAGRTQDEVIEGMEKVIEAQISQQVYISMHLRQGAVDIRSRDMSNTEKEKFIQAATGIASSIILESTPPHFHLQF